MRRVLVIAFSACAACLSQAQSQSSAECKPKIAITRSYTFHSLGGDQHSVHILVMNLDGTNAKQITEGYKPVWSHDGRKIAFDSVRGSDVPQLFVMNADGSNPHKIVKLSHDTAVFSATWSPDDSKIAFSATVNGKVQILVADLSSGEARQITEKSSWYPDWSPDGKQIVLVTDKSRALASISPTGTDFRELAVPAELTKCSHCFVAFPRWSPDGSQIAFVSNFEGIEGIYVMKSDGKSIRALINAKNTSFFNISWIPSGQALVFTIARQNVRTHAIPAEFQKLMMIRLDGAEIHSISAEPAGHASVGCVPIN